MMEIACWRACSRRRQTRPRAATSIALSPWVDEPTTDPYEQMREQDIMNLLAGLERQRVVVL